MEKSMSIVVVCALAATLGAGLVDAQTSPQDKRPNAILGTEVWDPFLILHDERVGSLDSLGEGICTKGQPAGIGPFQTSPECTENGRFINRGLVFSAPVASEDARLAGLVTVTANLNHDAFGNGPGWGTWIEKVDGGTFEGTYSSMRSLLPNDDNLPAACSQDLRPPFSAWPCWVERAQLAGVGTGSMQGRQIQLTMTFYSRFLQGLEFNAAAQAWIVPDER